jgi:von Willebrand factor type A domain
MALDASLELLTPAGAIVCLAALLPLAAAALGAARARRARTVLRLPPPPREIDLTSRVALAAVVVLLGLAAAQPVLARESSQEVRTDAQVIFVLDVSRSMAAAVGPDAPSRLDRARAAARRLRASIPQVEAGVATLTDRVLPDLLPVADAASFDGTLARSVGIDEPPPRSTAVRATSFAALEDVAAGNYFVPTAKNRVLVLLTDGESQPYDEFRVARALGTRGITLETIRIWKRNDSVFDADGKVDTTYRPDPTGALTLTALARATDGRTFEESDLDAAVSALRGTLGDGPTRRTAERRPDDLVLGSLVAALALVPLALLVYRRGARPTERSSGSYHPSI